jgi:hypothetical protein
MKRLPNIAIQTAPAWQRDRLERWLREWEADRRLPIPDLPNPAPLPPDPASTQTPVPGSIWLLHPSVTPAATRPVYISILQPADRSAGQLDVAPFGRFAEPALPGEWLTGRTTPALRVLCPWNSAAMSVAAIQRGWPVDQLTATEQEHALAVWAHVREDRPLPESLGQQVGPPLVHPLDPRWEYRDEEALLLTSSVSDALATNIIRYPSAAESQDIDLPLAADDRGEYETAIRLEVTGADLLLLATEVPDTDRLRLSVCDLSGKPSNQADGGRVETAGGEQSEKIRDGQVEIPASWLETDLTLVMPGGDRHRLHRP